MLGERLRVLGRVHYRIPILAGFSSVPQKMVHVIAHHSNVSLNSLELSNGVHLRGFIKLAPASYLRYPGLHENKQAPAVFPT